MQAKQHQDVLLELDRVSHFYDQYLVFKDISLKLGPGHVMLLGGPNGAGKTTLINIMTGLIQPAKGRVMSHASHEEVAFLGHHTFIYPGLSALDNLRFWADLYSLSQSQAELEELLELVGIKGFAHENARNFSRGMAQRLSLARVLMLRPRLMFLDEPATGMDVQSRQILRTQIVKAKQRGAALVWVSHFLEEDLDLADTVLYIDNKKAAFLGPPEQFHTWHREALQ